jgi:hypothetical protein
MGIGGTKQQEVSQAVVEMERDDDEQQDGSEEKKRPGRHGGKGQTIPRIPRVPNRVLQTDY